MDVSSRLHLIALTVTVAILAGYLGAVIGYAHGGNQHLVRYASSDAIQQVVNLRQLRAGEITDVIESLELALDTAIVEHWYYRPGLHQWLGWGIDLGTSDGAAKDLRNDAILMHQVTEYRDEFPWSNSSNFVRSYLAKF